MRPSADILCDRPLTFDLSSVGTQVILVLGHVHTNFSFSALFVFQLGTSTERTDV